MALSPSTWESEITQRSVTRRFAHDPKEIARARQMVRSQLEAWGLEDQPPALELAVSELATNAVVHGEGLIDVCIAISEGSVRLEVGDEGTLGERPALRHDSTEGGWGLRLVEDLSDDWGSGRDGRRTHVWMERRTQGRGDGSDIFD